MAVFGDALKGAMGGATAGAPFGGFGALAGGGLGALVGGLGGMFGGEPEGAEQKRLLLALASEAAGRGGPQDVGFSDFRGDQRDYLARLRALSEGTGPSLATEMLRKNTQDAAANQTAMAAGARGNPALAARTALNATAGITASAAQSAAQARAAEQLGAMQQLGLGIYGARGQDEGVMTGNADRQLRALAQQDATRLAALQASLGAGQLASQQPTFGDQIMGAGGALGQALLLAKQSRQGQGQTPYGKYTPNQMPTSTPSGYSNQYNPYQGSRPGF